MDGPLTPDQSTHMDLSNIEQTQMATPITTKSFPTLSIKPILMLKPLDKQKLMPKRNLTSGEMDSLPTLDQFFPFNKDTP